MWLLLSSSCATFIAIAMATVNTTTVVFFNYPSWKHESCNWKWEANRFPIANSTSCHLFSPAPNLPPLKGKLLPCIDIIRTMSLIWVIITTAARRHKRGLFWQLNFRLMYTVVFLVFHLIVLVFQPAALLFLFTLTALIEVFLAAAGSCFFSLAEKL